jgi:hypothetical protein
MRNTYKQLGAAIVLQAVKDYFKADDDMKRCIIKELKSEYLYQFAGRTSFVVAEALEKNPKEIAARLKMYDEKLNLGGVQNV